VAPRISAFPDNIPDNVDDASLRLFLLEVCVFMKNEVGQLLDITLNHYAYVHAAIFQLCITSAMQISHPVPFNALHGLKSLPIPITPTTKFVLKFRSSSGFECQ
jgi:hypothetical protein